MPGRKSVRIKQVLIRSLCLKHSLFCFNVADQALHCLLTSESLSNCKSYIVLSQVTDHCSYSRMFHIRSSVRHSRIIYWKNKCSFCPQSGYLLWLILGDHQAAYKYGTDV